MDDAGARTVNVRQMAPLLNVADMAASLRFYVDGLGCRMTNQWVDAGELRWCWLAIGDAAVMIQTKRGDGPDGYRLDFESPTDVTEETVYEGE